MVGACIPFTSGAFPDPTWWPTDQKVSVGAQRVEFNRHFYVVLSHSRVCELPAPSDSREKVALTGEEGMSEVMHVTGEGE